MFNFFKKKTKEEVPVVPADLELGRKLIEAYVDGRVTIRVEHISQTDGKPDWMSEFRFMLDGDEKFNYIVWQSGELFINEFEYDIGPELFDVMYADYVDREEKKRQDRVDARLAFKDKIISQL